MICKISFITKLKSSKALQLPIFLFYQNVFNTCLLLFQITSPKAKSTRSTHPPWGCQSPQRTILPERHPSYPELTSRLLSVPLQGRQTVTMRMSSHPRGNRDGIEPPLPVSNLKSWRRPSPGHIILMFLRGQFYNHKEDEPKTGSLDMFVVGLEFIGLATTG